MLILPQDFPAAATLQAEHAQVATQCPPGSKSLRILFLNLMPQKLVTELDIARALAQPGLTVELLPMKIAGQTYKTTPMEHMVRFYKDFEEYEGGLYDGLIVTGAPVEHLPFEEVRYWPQLCRIMDWARTHAASTLYICWGAQAGLYHHYGIPKHALPAKKFGIFGQRAVAEGQPILAGLEPVFPMPNSRHTEVRRADFPADASLRIVAESQESGVGIAVGREGKEVFIVGHLEYEPRTLHNEYVRDLNKGLPIAPPLHYYINDKPEEGIDFSWQETARRFYRNWLGLCAAATPQPAPAP